MSLRTPPKKPMRAGNRAGICTRCHLPIVKGQWIKAAPGRYIQFRHVECPKGR